MGSGFASPVIVGGKVILFHRKGDREIVEAFEASTGKTLWTFDYPTLLATSGASEATVHRALELLSGIQPTPAFRDGGAP